MIWLFILVLIFFIPFPIHTTFEYKNSNLSIYLYKQRIYPSRKLKRKIKKKIKKVNCNIPYPKTFYLDVIKKIYNKLVNIIFKSTLYLDIDLNYGFEDAYITGVLYGILQSIFSIIYSLISYVFKLKKFRLNINPIFNKSILNFTIKSIIFINLAKIIYIALSAFIYVKNEAKLYLNPKEVS